MEMNRIFTSPKFLQSAADKPVRSLITQSGDVIIVSWHVRPGQSILSHIHPGGQDIWIIQAGNGDYHIDDAGNTESINAGDVVIAYTGQVHGVTNNGQEPLIFISVLSPVGAGFQLV
ncbi:cupin domain-containing protein [Salmonella enterica]|nr:cupin domain-containing protein [Salmonella enterica]EIR2445401.1 cupin domain-containing protein [Salmonella enterica subsp. enterica serovar Newport]EJI0209855.1 cupin domain-containing protein [Salmonella enterica subsp. enterica]EKQ9927882.1 cupin domain-containing protein [Salmonella enterica subsp. enterica serovar Panama]EID3014796.1 cupin domain-containing protein [Salmonella enterica]EIQ6929054.1 cupin domain-containing protein [Salmonella enterica]